MFDINKVKEEITKEEGISKEEKEIFLFLTNCIIKSLSRNHIKKADKIGSPAKKLDLADYLLDYHYPRTNSEWLGTANFNSMNDLISYGWFQEERKILFYRNGKRIFSSPF